MCIVWRIVVLVLYFCIVSCVPIVRQCVCVYVCDRSQSTTLHGVDVLQGLPRTHRGTVPGVGLSVPSVGLSALGAVGLHIFRMQSCAWTVVGSRQFIMHVGSGYPTCALRPLAHSV